MKFQNKTKKKFNTLITFSKKDGHSCVSFLEKAHIHVKVQRVSFFHAVFFLNKEKKIQIKLPRPEDGETTTFSEDEPLCPDDQEQILQNWNCRSVTVLKLCMVTS